MRYVRKANEIGPTSIACLLISVLVSGWAQPTWAQPAPAPAVSVTPALGPDPYPLPPELVGVDLSKQSAEEAQRKSTGCLHCHTGSRDPHFKDTVRLGCTDCHGGDATSLDKNCAHVLPAFPNAWTSSANPVRSYTLLNHERPEFIQFVNPGDLRIAHIACGSCHQKETLQVRKSMMTHGCMLWGAALYNNGATPNKWPQYGESYSMHGVPQRLQTVPPPTPEETATKGVLPFLDPLPRYQISQPANILRIFERGGRFVPEIGIPEKGEEPGRPRTRLSVRGLGTANRTDPVFIGLQKTRLLDPTLNFLGTNDQPGDYRSSGCTACHIVYANDRSPVHSGPYAKYGNRGMAATEPDGFATNPDPMIPPHESGHPIAHRFTTAIPTSQCIVCHIHPGTTVMNSYLGYMWWDEESEGELMYPPETRDHSAEELAGISMRNPDEAAARGNWSDPEFLANITDLNTTLRTTQFADFHGHGWVFRAVFKKDHQGQFLTHSGEPITELTSAKLQAAVQFPQTVKETHKKLHALRDDLTDKEFLKEMVAAEQALDQLRDDLPVHMLDIHLEKGMHCVDCHFVQDAHGNGKLYGEVRAAIEIQCIDCHGTPQQKATLRTSGPAAEDRPAGQPRGRNLLSMRTPFGLPRFEFRGDQLVQNSMVEEGLSWNVTQVVDTINPAKPETYNAKSALAKTVRFKDESKTEFVWGDLPKRAEDCAHSQGNMSCIACHSSWNPSCYGCHLPQKANKKRPDLHNEGDVTRNLVSYNFQTLRDEIYMLARDGNVTGNRIGPSRSSCSIHVGSYNGNRESIYVQQQTISGEGLSGVAFSTNVPHTVRGKGETKVCTDCHVSAANDNNARLTQLTMQGTNAMNFMGRYTWVASGEHGLHAVIVTEQEEPQAVIGSSLHQIAFPEHYAKHVEHNLELEHAHEHPGNDIVENVTRPFQKPEVLGLQNRGEYLYAACGSAGLRVYDIAFIDNKAFSERITTAPVSPAGQKFYVRTKYATAVAAPSTMAPDPTRTHRPENHEPSVHSLYAYLYVADKYEGLILVGAGTLLDGDPTNNFLKRDLTFNPSGILCGARAITIVGTYAYISCDAGLVVVCLDDPLKPYVTKVLGEEEHLHHPTCVQVQFRYGFVCDHEGLKVLDTTNLAEPKVVAHLDLEDAHSVYVSRTYAYVAAGHHGLVIVDVANPEDPRIDQVYNADGCIQDLHDVKLAITYVSQFAYLADGEHGLHVVQLTSAETPGNYGFSPRPTPRLVATYKIPHEGHALMVAEALDRDRAVDESGNQLAVFGRVGARPFSKDEVRKLFLRPDGSTWTVIDEADPAFYGTQQPLLPRRISSGKDRSLQERR
jgi:formate-dependent nitrite reductase cytochrome c552 subunit